MLKVRAQDLGLNFRVEGVGEGFRVQGLGTGCRFQDFGRRGFGAGYAWKGMRVSSLEIDV